MTCVWLISACTSVWSDVVFARGIYVVHDPDFCLHISVVWWQSLLRKPYGVLCSLVGVFAWGSLRHAWLRSASISVWSDGCLCYRFLITYTTHFCLYLSMVWWESLLGVPDEVHDSVLPVHQWSLLRVFARSSLWHAWLSSACTSDVVWWVSLLGVYDVYGAVLTAPRYSLIGVFARGSLWPVWLSSARKSV